ncbi:MAG: hypothetical protein WAM03_15750, partial [Pseudolabrys sp.]
EQIVQDYTGATVRLRSFPDASERLEPRLARRVHDENSPSRRDRVERPSYGVPARVLRSVRDAYPVHHSHFHPAPAGPRAHAAAA